MLWRGLTRSSRVLSSPLISVASPPSYSLSRLSKATNSKVNSFHTCAPISQAKEDKPKEKKSNRPSKGEASKELDLSQFSRPVVNPPTSFTIPLYSIKTGSTTVIGEQITLDSSIFGVPVRPDILHRVVIWKLASKRTGTAMVKTRGEVHGSKQKLAPQKGRGKARVGPKRSPTRRGGGKAHGPRPRDFSYTLPKKVRRLGLRCALAAKFAQNKLIVLNGTELEQHKTKPLKQTLVQAVLGWNSAYIVDTANVNVMLYLAARNIPGVDLVPQQKSNVYDILNHEYLIIHKDTLPYFFDRVNGKLPRVLKKKGIAYRRMLAAEAESENYESTNISADTKGQKAKEI